MKGHLRERSPGHWAIVLDTHDPETGKRKRRWHSFRGTKREAQIECARLISNGAMPIDIARETVTAFLERWLEHMKGQVSPRSLERYQELIRKNVVPLLGGVRLAKLEPAQISAAYAKALTGGRRDGKGGLSPRTVTHMHRVLRQALQQALVWHPSLNRNAAVAVKPPKVERKPQATYDTDETAQALEALRPTRMFIPAMLGLLCGLRRGEITALRWRSVDLDPDNSPSSPALSSPPRCREKDLKNSRCRTLACRRWQSGNCERTRPVRPRSCCDWASG